MSYETLFPGVGILPDEKVLLYLRKDGKVILNENDEIIKKIFEYCEEINKKNQ